MSYKRNTKQQRPPRPDPVLPTIVNGIWNFGRCKGHRFETATNEYLLWVLENVSGIDVLSRRSILELLEARGIEPPEVHKRVERKPTPKPVTPALTAPLSEANAIRQELGLPLLNT